MITQLLPLIAKSMHIVAVAPVKCKKWSNVENRTVVWVNVTELDRTRKSSLPSPSSQAVPGSL